MAIKTESFSDARSFVTALRWTDDRWYKDIGRWVFRGHADADWLLVPTLLRERAADRSQYFKMALRTLNIAEKAGARPAHAPPGQVARFYEACAIILAEHYSLIEYARLADELRFQIPVPIESIDLSPEVGNMGDEINRIMSWNPSDPLPPPDQLAALGQHHGIPTRLLDWSGNPLVAAFFAALDIGGSRKAPAAKELAVWALHPIAELFSGSRLRFLRYGRQGNAFLQAQRGLFTWDAQAEREFISTGRWPCQREVLTVSPMFGGLPEIVMRKLILPRSEAPELLHLLRVEGISLAHLKPSLDSIAQTVMLNSNWPFRRA